MWTSICPSTICWKDFCSSLSCVLILVKNQLIVSVRAYICTLSFIPLISVSVLKPILLCLDYCSCAVSFKIWKCESSTLFQMHLNFWYQIWWEVWMNSTAWGLGPILKASCQEHKLQVWHLPWRDGFPPSQPTVPHDKLKKAFCREQWSPRVILNITFCLPYLLCSLIALTETVSFTAGLLMN